MNPAILARQLRETKEWFDRSSRCLTEEDSTFAPAEGAMTAAQQVAHVARTVDWFVEGAAAIEKISSSTAEELATPLPPGPVMGGAPRAYIVSGIADHTSHHRGVLTVYSRLRGHVPAMPYMEM